MKLKNHAPPPTTEFNIDQELNGSGSVVNEADRGVTVVRYQGCVQYDI
jgi:hypothetical protein